jgi:isopenicillin-N N-acyltransferase like protein
MKRREFLSLSAVVLSGCALRVDPFSPFIRSEWITTPEQEQAILSRARLGTTPDGKMRVLYVQGSPYEMGYQHGALLRKEVQDNLEYLYSEALDQFYFEEIFDEAYERMRPYIPQSYIDEMHGLAHGAKLPLRTVHAIHALPEITEWGGKKRVKQVVKQMMKGELGTSCSNLCATGPATADGKPYVVRILDWGLHKISKLHEYPLITVAKPTGKVAFANIGWVGFLGAVSGMNAEGITLGEMGYGDPPHETLRGTPMPFLLREVLAECRSLGDVRRTISKSPGTSSFVFLMSDGKTGESELYVKDRERFLAFPPGVPIEDGAEEIRPIDSILYGGHFREKMETLLTQKRGVITPEVLMKEVIPEIAMKSNFQNVIYSPSELTFWVSNAKDRGGRAAEADYSFFNLSSALGSS